MFEAEEYKDVIYENGIYRCPVCNSKRITYNSQCVLHKSENINTGKELDPTTKKSGMSNRRKARLYDTASGEGVGCWHYECRKCGWVSDLFAE